MTSLYVGINIRNLGGRLGSMQDAQEVHGLRTRLTWFYDSIGKCNQLMDALKLKPASFSPL